MSEFYLFHFQILSNLFELIRKKQIKANKNIDQICFYLLSLFFYDYWNKIRNSISLNCKTMKLISTKMEKEKNGFLFQHFNANQNLKFKDHLDKVSSKLNNAKRKQLIRKSLKLDELQQNVFTNFNFNFIRKAQSQDNKKFATICLITEKNLFHRTPSGKLKLF